ncbi:MAG: hypothetical protein K1X71_11185 [Pirellulales bacterium]|nr:hypothetical protein [Pirellulales bacterium]
MPIDSYSPCPGGFDKKVKFCCADLVHDLDKLSRMIEGDQRVAALESIAKIEAKHPNRACLMALKCSVLAAGQREDDLQQAVGQFVAAHPTNPVALAESALFAARDKGQEAGIGLLQDALERVDRNIPVQLYDALGGMAMAAISSGRPAAALAHLILQNSLDPDDKAPVQMLTQLLNSPQLPLLLKDHRKLVPAPADASWAPQFDKIMVEAIGGRWRRAAAQLVDLAGRNANPPVVWQNIAMLRSWLGENAAAVGALRFLTSLDIPYDQAVEAEALAQLLEPVDNLHNLDIVATTYPVLDAERLGELLASADVAVAAPIDEERFAAEDDNPPPRAAYLLLDRPHVKNDTPSLGLADIPRALATALLFGKQTDREARLELIACRDAQFSAAHEALAQIADGAIGPAGDEEVLDKIPMIRHALAPQWRLPDDISLTRFQELTRDFQQHNLYERWPRLPLPVLDNKTPLAVKGDPKYRLRLAALALLLELSAQGDGDDFDFGRLREELGLPPVEPIDLATVDIEALPMARFPRLDLAKLSDEQLVQVYSRVVMMNYRLLLSRAGREILARPSLGERYDLSPIYRTLALNVGPTDEGLRWVDEGRQWAAGKGQSCAPWDLEELGLRLQRGEEQEAVRLLDHIARQHGNEPGVRAALGNLLQMAGIAPPGGVPRGRMPTDESTIAATAAPVDPGRIWTPEGEAGGAQKSKLWVPGMD